MIDFVMETGGPFLLSLIIKSLLICATSLLLLLAASEIRLKLRILKIAFFILLILPFGVLLIQVVPAIGIRLPRQGRAAVDGAALTAPDEGHAPAADTMHSVPDSRSANESPEPGTSGSEATTLLRLPQADAAATPMTKDPQPGTNATTPPASSILRHAKSIFSRSSKWLVLGGLVIFGALLIVKLIRMILDYCSIRSQALAGKSFCPPVPSKLPIRVVSGMISPCLFGIVSPVILVPRALSKSLTHSAWRAIVSHEEAHWAAGDHWMAYVQELVNLIYVWNPLCRLLVRQWRLLREVRADFTAATQFASRAQYSRELVGLVETFVGCREVAAFGVSSQSKSTFFRRIEIMLTRKTQQTETTSQRKFVKFAGLLIFVLWSLLIVGCETRPKSTVHQSQRDNNERVKQLEAQNDKLKKRIRALETGMASKQAGAAVPDAAVVAKADPASNPDQGRRRIDEVKTTDNSDALEKETKVVETGNMSNAYASRSEANRKAALSTFDASPAGQKAVDKALKWLASVQQDNGAWGTDSPAHTGMALLVFLAHGETPASKTYGNTVLKAMKWLAKQVNESKTGDLGQKSYGHAIATYALCESYGMTRLPFLRGAMKKALGVIISGQQNGGGFSYNYAKTARWDLSISGWQFQALKAGHISGSTNRGLEDAIRKSVLFCRRTAYANKKFGYTRTGSGRNMTGVGTVALQLLGQGKCAEAKGGLDTISNERLALYKKVADDPRQWDAVAGSSLYGWYYDTQAMFNAQHDAKGKKLWKEWRPAFEKVLVRHQKPDGYWEVAKGHGMGANLPGRIMSTCWSALQLEVYYR